MKQILLILSIFCLIHCSASRSVKPSEDLSVTSEKPKLSSAYFVDLNNDGNYQIVELSDEQQPKPIIGQEAFLTLFSTSIRYPAVARNNGDQGTVWLNTYINESGRITDIIIKEGISKELDASSISAFTIASKDGFEPLIIDGQPKKYIYQFPVKFKTE